MDDAQRTPLYAWHAAHRGRMVDFSGWQMPVTYDSIVQEHLATRRDATLFDISHMARFRFDGQGAAAFLDRLCTRRITDLKLGQVRYSLMTREDGGILDDVLVYHLEDGTTEFYWLVANAGNRNKIRQWIERHLASAADVHLTDQTRDTAMIALQGPLAEQIMMVQFPTFNAHRLGYYQGQVRQLDGGAATIISRTGYTGEDGFEMTVPAALAEPTWRALLESAPRIDRPVGTIKPAGLGARDTLRMEAGMPLYGHELSESVHPFQAGLGFAVNLQGREFVGHAALQAAKQQGHFPRLVGLTIDGKRVAREGYAVCDEGRSVGNVTSGTFSPTLQRPIAMAYIESDTARHPTALSVDLRGKTVSAQLAELPFYKRA